VSTEQLEEAIAAADVIIARSGYSTIMDLAVLGKKAIFIPTPGQTEQLYLANRLMRTGIAYSAMQYNFNLALAMDEQKKYRGFSAKSFDNALLMQALDKLLAQA
jgi:UDP-N-acetylglucosamine:LPS N-acetylglucosamine transferase